MQSTPSPTASANPTPVAQATPTPPPDSNRTAKFIVLLYHRFEDRPAELSAAQAEEPFIVTAKRGNIINYYTR